MKKAFAKSIAGHAIILLAFIVGARGAGKSEKQLEDEASKDFSGSEVQVFIIPKSDGPGDKKCKKWYGGIGITVTFRFDEKSSTNLVMVNIVSSGYPADKAGLQKGDIFLGTQEIRGEPGTTLAVTVRRGNAEFPLTIIREKICTDN